MEIEKININEHTKDEIEFLQQISKAIEAIDGVKKISVSFLIYKCKFGRELANDVFKYLQDKSYISEDFSVNQSLVANS